MLRFVVAIFAGGAIAFGLFVFMAYLISGGDRSHLDQSESIRVEIFSNPPKSSVQERKRVPPPPPPPPKTPPKQVQPEPEQSDSDPSAININMPSVDVGGADVGLAGPGSALGRDGDATPIVRVEPRYPIQAARDGTEGWVIMSFTIDEIGGVTDIKVIDAKPKRVFDREAKRALRKWKYKPKVVDGKAVKQFNQRVQLDFSLQKGG